MLTRALVSCFTVLIAHIFSLFAFMCLCFSLLCFYPPCFLLYFTVLDCQFLISWWRLSLRPWTRISRSVVGPAPPKVASSTPQVSLPSHVSVVTANVCVGVSVWVCVWVCMYLCRSLCMSVGVGGLGSFNFLLSIFSRFLLSVVVFNLCKAAWLTVLYEIQIKIDLIWFEL